MDKRDKDQVLAVVAGEEITNADLDAFLETAPNEHSAYIANPKYREAYLERDRHLVDGAAYCTRDSDGTAYTLRTVRRTKNL